MNSPLIGVVPAYCPPPTLPELIRELSALEELAEIIVIDDGGGAAHEAVFAAVRRLSKVTLLTHPVNRGKGAALKTAFRHILAHRPDVAGAVTIDADGQHRPEDIQKLSRAFREAPEQFWLGVRDFRAAHATMPWRSRFGNRMTEVIFRFLTGSKVSDTQTGLRCYPARLLPDALQIERDRYEFELEILLQAPRLGIALAQLPITTVYEADNPTSHFHWFRDSVKIYLVLLRFTMATLICVGVDNLIYFGVLALGAEWELALSVARPISVGLNFILCRQTVFRSQGNIRRQLLQFVLLALVLYSGSALGIELLTTYAGWPSGLAKIPIESLLFFGSYLIQNRIIFCRRPE